MLVLTGIPQDIASATLMKDGNLTVDDSDDSMEIDLLVKGVRSSPVVKGIHLSLALQWLSFSQIITQIREFSGLDCLVILLQELYVVSDDDAGHLTAADS